MRSLHVAAAMTLALLPALANAQPARVSFAGCPSAGLPRGCVLVRSGHRTFDISSARPPIRSTRFGIRGSGMRGGQNVCTRGTALSDVRYSFTRHQCVHNERMHRR